MSDDPERRAQRAQALLDDPLLNEAFAMVEADCLAQWRATSPLAHKKREAMFSQVKALETVRAKLQSVVIDGKIAKANR